MQPHPQLAAPINSSTTFQQIADVHYWLRLHCLQLEDIERAISNACRREGGATTGEILRQLTTEFGMQPQDEDHVLWLIAYCAFTGTIEHVGRGVARRFRANTPPPEPRVTALVSIPSEEYDLIRPYVFRGRPAWLTEG